MITQSKHQCFLLFIIFWRRDPSVLQKQPSISFTWQKVSGNYQSKPLPLFKAEPLPFGGKLLQILTPLEDDVSSLSEWNHFFSWQGYWGHGLHGDDGTRGQKVIFVWSDRTTSTGFAKLTGWNSMIHFALTVWRHDKKLGNPIEAIEECKKYLLASLYEQCRRADLNFANQVYSNRQIEPYLHGDILTFTAFRPSNLRYAWYQFPSPPRANIPKSVWPW